VLTSAVGDVHLRSPHIYEDANGVRQEVHGGYVIKNKEEVGFEVAAYDRRRALVIDPVLAYSTFLGGTGLDEGSGIAVDAAGNAYATGWTLSTDFPTVSGIQPVNRGNGDVFVAKFHADGTALVYSTYLGGVGGDRGTAVAVDATGNAHVTGWTESTDFPTFKPIQSANHGDRDVFVTKLSADGTALIYSTYLGGSIFDSSSGIAVDSAGNTYLTGVTRSKDFPTKNAVQPTYGGGEQDAFVTKINATGSALVYSTYLGGSLHDEAGAIAVDSNSRAYVTGWTESTDFPLKNAFQSINHGGTNNGAADAFVTKINAAGSALVYSTYLGGNDFDQGSGIVADSAGNAYVTGITTSTDFPTVNAIQPSLPVGTHAFVTKVSANGSALAYSTYLGGSGMDLGLGIKVDPSGNAYVAGFTSSGDFPTVNAIKISPIGGFLSNINAAGTAFIYSTYVSSSGQMALDSANSVYLVASAGSGYPTTPLAFQLSPSGDQDAAIAKIASVSFVHLSSQKLLFPTQLIGTTSAPTKIRFRNLGSSTLVINKIYIGGLNSADFAQTNNCGAALAPGASCAATVTFTPSTKNGRRAGLGFSSADPARPDAVTLSGSGTVVSLSPPKLSFGSEAVGTTSAPLSRISAACSSMA